MTVFRLLHFRFYHPFPLQYIKLKTPLTVSAPLYPLSAPSASHLKTLPRKLRAKPEVSAQLDFSFARAFFSPVSIFKIYTNYRVGPYKLRLPYYATLVILLLLTSTEISHNLKEHLRLLHSKLTGQYIYETITTYAGNPLVLIYLYNYCDYQYSCATSKKCQDRCCSRKFTGKSIFKDPAWIFGQRLLCY